VKSHAASLCEPGSSAAAGPAAALVPVTIDGQLAVEAFVAVDVAGTWRSDLGVSGP
jgi:hypothetical protein